MATSVIQYGLRNENCSVCNRAFVDVAERYTYVNVNRGRESWGSIGASHGEDISHLAHLDCLIETDRIYCRVCRQSVQLSDGLKSVILQEIRDPGTYAEKLRENRRRSAGLKDLLIDVLWIGGQGMMIFGFLATVPGSIILLIQGFLVGTVFAFIKRLIESTYNFVYDNFTGRSWTQCIINPSGCEY